MTKLTAVFRSFTNASKSVVTIETGWQSVAPVSAASDLETLNLNQQIEMSTLSAIRRLLLCPDGTDSRFLRNVRD